MVLFEDSFGFLWMGTNAGLFRYDGNQLKGYQYNVFDQASIPNNTINSIVEDENTDLWIGSESYLIFYDRSEDEFTGHFKNYTANCLAIEDGSYIWSRFGKKGTIRLPLEELTGQALRMPDERQRVSQLSMDALVEDDFDRLLLGGAAGLFLYDPVQGGMQTLRTEWRVVGLEKEKDQGLWIATPTEVHLAQYAKDTTMVNIIRSYSIADQSPESPLISCMTISPKGELWIGTNQGLFRVNTQDPTATIESVEDEDDLLGGQISSIIVDQYHNLWVGSWKGVVKFTDRSDMFQFHELQVTNKSVKHDQIMGIMDRGGASVWLSTNSSGLFEMNKTDGKCTLLLAEDRNITFIKPDEYSLAYLLGIDNELYQLDETNQGVVTKTLIHKTQRKTTDCVQIDPYETWIGTWEGGLVIRAPGKIITEWKRQLQTTLLGHHISVMHKDQKGNIWIGTRGEGLYRVDMSTGTHRHYPPSLEHGVTSNAFLAITEDPAGKIWLGTRGGGLLQYDYVLDSFQAFTVQDGLPSNTITALELDHERNVWVSTEDGVAVYQNDSGNFFSFDRADGVLGSGFVYNSSASSLDHKQILFGSIGGFYTIETDNFQQKDKQASILITDFLTYSSAGEAVRKWTFSKDPTQIVKLPFTQNNIVLEYASLDLTAPGRNQYAYQLEGVNDYWIYPKDNDNQAVFFDLSPGTYQFKVKGTNSDGVWSEQQARLTIQIQPPFHLSSLAYGIYGLLLFGLIYGLVLLSRRWYRMKRSLLAQRISQEKDIQHHRMRMTFFTDISHELRTPLTLILTIIEMLFKKDPSMRALPELVQIHENGMKMNALIGQIMDISKHSEGQFKLQVKAIELDRFIRGVVLPFVDVAEKQEKYLHFQSSLKTSEGYLDPSLVEKILTNLLSNGLKYTQGGDKIEVQANLLHLQSNEIPGFALQAGQYLRILVKDSGIGMEQEDLLHIFDRYYQAQQLQAAHLSGTGIGMELVHKLTLLHKAAITVQSKKEEFTVFQLYLPIEEQHYQRGERLKNSMPQLPAKEAVTSSTKLETNSVADRPSRQQSCEILIVEDNQQLRETLAQVLATEYQVQQAATGREGYELAKLHLPKLILSDIMMPQWDGVSMLRELKENASTRHIPIFFLTAKVDQATRQSCIEMGGAAFIEKPFSMDFLYWRIRNALQQQDFLREKYSKQISTNATTLELDSPDEILVKRVIELIENHLASPQLSVAFLANEVGMSRANLYRKLRKLLNDTPVNLIKNIRLERAKQILEMEKFYIAEVAYLCGFQSQKYFSKCFQKKFGCTPTVFAKEKRQLIQEDDPLLES